MLRDIEVALLACLSEEAGIMLFGMLPGTPEEQKAIKKAGGAGAAS